jgi:hypothetical protein
MHQRTSAVTSSQIFPSPVGDVDKYQYTTGSAIDYVQKVEYTRCILCHVHITSVAISILTQFPAFARTQPNPLCINVSQTRVAHFSKQEAKKQETIWHTLDPPCVGFR